MIYTVTTKRMQVWTHRVSANSSEEAKTIGDRLCEDEAAHDDYGDETTAKPSNDQTSEPDNVE